jgi:hypothetical protein
MADQTTPPAKPEDAAKKDDKAQSPESFALPKSQQLSRSQQVFIWALVLFVGILFGAGPIADTLLGQTNRVAYVAGDISENDIHARQGVAVRLQRLLNPKNDPTGEFFDPSLYGRGLDRDGMVRNFWVERIKTARYADSLGLQPAGAPLEELVKQFLNKPLPGSKDKRYVDALQEAEGTDGGVTLQELRRHLAEERGAQLVMVARVAVPAVPVAAGDLVNALPPRTQQDYFSGHRGDQVAVDEVILTARHLLPEVKDDDPEIQTTYDRLKGTRFTRPAAVEASVAFADVTALAARVVVPDADVEAYYNAHTDDFRKPVEPPKPEEKKVDEKKPEGDTAKAEEKTPEPPKVEYKPLAEVAPEIRSKLARERAESQAKELVRQFDVAAEDLLQDKDNIRFKAKAAELGLSVREQVFIEEPRTGGTLDAGEFGMLSESQLHLFNQELGAITSAVQSTGPKATWLVLRIDGRRDAGFRELADPAVKAEIKAVLAGERAYKDLLAKAEEIRAAAEKLGPGGLKQWAGSDAAKPWEAKVTNNKLSSLQQVVPPAPEAGGPAIGDGRMLASLAMPERPVVLGDSPAQADVPAVRLVQVTDYLPANPATGEARVERAGTYRDLLERYRSALFQRELNDQLTKN